MSRPRDVLGVWGVMPNGREYPAFFLRYSRTLCCLAGPIGTGVPIIIRYRCSRRKALKLKERIKQKGFYSVALRRLPKKEGIPRA